MLKLRLEDIKIIDRQRREFDPVRLQELANSIQKNGLQNAIVVRPWEGGWRLVSGERRYRAIEQLHFLKKPVRYSGEGYESPLVPCVDHGQLDELAAQEAEFDENIHRADYTWQERAEATAKLDRLRAGQVVAAQATGDFAQITAAEKAATVAALAEKIRGSSEGYHQEVTRRELIVSKHMDKPEVRAAKSLEDAFKALKKTEDVKRRTDLAAAVGKTFTADIHSAYQVDCLEWMKAYDGPQFDVILSDPPYGMGADQFGDSGGKTVGAHDYDDSYENWQKLMPAFLDLSLKVVKPLAHLYLFCDIDRFHELRSMAEAVGWECFRTPLIWVNPQRSRLPWVDFGPQRKYEIALYAKRGAKPVTRIFPDVVSYPPDKNIGHPAQKPVVLFSDFLKRSVGPGDRALDAFAGSGPIFPAAHELKCSAVGLEMAPHHYANCLKRLEDLKAQGELPV